MKQLLYGLVVVSTLLLISCGVVDEDHSGLDRWAAVMNQDGGGFKYIYEFDNYKPFEEHCAWVSDSLGTTEERILVLDDYLLSIIKQDGSEVDGDYYWSFTGTEHMAISHDRHSLVFGDRYSVTNYSIFNFVNQNITETTDMHYLWPSFSLNDENVLCVRSEGIQKDLISINIATKDVSVIYSNENQVLAGAKYISDSIIVGKPYIFGRATTFSNLVSYNLETRTTQVITDETISYFDVSPETGFCAYLTTDDECVLVSSSTWTEIIRIPIERKVREVSYPVFCANGSKLIVDNSVLDVNSLSVTKINRDFITQPQLNYDGSKVVAVVNKPE